MPESLPDTRVPAPGPRAAEVTPRRAHLAGLDTLRFVCAMIVVLDHVGLFTIDPAFKAAGGWRLVLAGVLNCLFNGPAAVVAFFIISGLCIHLPYRGARMLLLPEYYARRFLRIGIPAIVFVLYLRLVLKDSTPLEETVLWSIFCEMAYYLIYPALRLLRRSMSWVWMTAISLAISLALSLTHLAQLRAAQNAITALGLGLTWLVALPMWLMGCWLAEHYDRFPTMSATQIWLLRGAVFALSVALRLAKFHMASVVASNCFTLIFFSFLAVFWIGCEVAYAARHKPLRVLEWAGTWSYSIYLVHTLAAASLAMAARQIFANGGSAAKVILVMVTLAASYAFYLVCERPSHQLAVKVGRFFAHRDAA